MPVFNTVRKLSSFSSCTDEVISREVIGKILEAGRQAPSPGNVQSLEFIVVEDEDVKEFISRAADDPRIEEAPTAVVLLGDFDRMSRKVGQRHAREACSSEAASAVQNMRLVAEEEGIASCWIGGFDEDAVADQLDVPEGKRPLAVVPLAYSDDRIERDSKFGLNSIAFYDTYGNKLESLFDSLHFRGIKGEADIRGRRKGVIHRAGRKIRKYL